MYKEIKEELEKIHAKVDQIIQVYNARVEPVADKVSNRITLSPVTALIYAAVVLGAFLLGVKVE